MLIGAPKEAGPQGYEYLLRDTQRCAVDIAALEDMLAARSYSDIILFPGGFDLDSAFPVIGKSAARVYVDANFEPALSRTFEKLGRNCETIILSTSSNAFLKRYHGAVEEVCSDLLGQYAGSILLKENRGGSRLFVRDQENNCIRTPAQLRKIQHSVGVGDCFDVVFAVMRRKMPDRAALAYASCIAAEYAGTTYPELFKDAALGWLAVPEDEIVELAGSFIAWEERPTVQIYIAAPDFDHVDRRPIDAVAECLKYHNFVARLPIREHGQMGKNATTERKQALCDADLRLLGECQMVVAVLPYDDPGTLIEIGIAAERGLPVIVYDPYNRAENLMLTQLPALVSADMDEIISAVFKHASRIICK
jgi:nucleoside 2-deoxyribosyltransferase